MKTALLLFALCLIAAAQTPGTSGAGGAGTEVLKPKFEPSEIQKLRLENAQLKLKLTIATTVQAAQNEYNQRMAEFNAVCETIKTENKWTAKATCDPSTLQVSLPVEPTKPASK